MRKMITLMAVVAITALPLALIGCEEEHYYRRDNHYYPNGNRQQGQSNDDDFWVAMAQTMAGKWRGTMRAYEIDKSGKAIDSIDFSTDIEFIQSNSRAINGTGTQYDFKKGNSSDNADYVRAFSWEIDRQSGDVYLTYKEQKGDYKMRIPYKELNLNDRVFTGYLYAADGGEIDDFYFKRYSANVKQMKIVFEE